MGMVVPEWFACETIEAIVLNKPLNWCNHISSYSKKTEERTISGAENGLNSPTLSPTPLVACVMEASCKR